MPGCGHKPSQRVTGGNSSQFLQRREPCQRHHLQRFPRHLSIPQHGPVGSRPAQTLPNGLLFQQQPASTRPPCRVALSGALRRPPQLVGAPGWKARTSSAIATQRLSVAWGKLGAGEHLPGTRELSAAEQCSGLLAPPLGAGLPHWACAGRDCQPAAFQQGHPAASQEICNSFREHVTSDLALSCPTFQQQSWGKEQMSRPA